MRQCSHLFEWLKAIEKIKAYTAHGIDCQNELSAKLETTKIVEVIAWKAAVKGTGLLRKAEMNNDMLQVKIC